MPSVLFPERPDPTTGAEGQRQWYFFWDSQLTMIYGPTPKGSSITDAQAPMFLSLLSDVNLRKALMLRKDIAFTQRALSQKHADAIATGSSFESRWVALGRDGREAALENALTKMVPSSRCIEDWWMYCPDMRKSVMCSGTGEKFTSLVRHFLVTDLVNLPSPDFPVLFNERVWSQYGIAHPGSEAADFPRPAAIRAFHDMTVIQRHYFLVMVCYHTLTKACDLKDSLTFREFDDTAPQSADEKAMQARSSQLAMDMMSPSHKAHFEKLLGQHLSEPESPVCHVCKKGKPEGVHLQHCSKCQKIDRRMLYCSRECQIFDYKQVTAEVQSDMTLDCGADAVLPVRGKRFDREQIPVGSEIAAKHWPVNTVADFTRFLRGLSFALSVYSRLVDAEALPTLQKFDAKLAQYEATQPGSFRLHRGTLDDYKFVKKQGATAMMVMLGLMKVACEQVAEGTFEEIYGDEMLEMPVCEEHDDDFTTVSLLLATTRS
ncbi:hypothetical protein RQP46_003508 [Phenoliferia psychrophenolica]